MSQQPRSAANWKYMLILLPPAMDPQPVKAMWSSSQDQIREQHCSLCWVSPKVNTSHLCISQDTAIKHHVGEQQILNLDQMDLCGITSVQQTTVLPCHSKVTVPHWICLLHKQFRHMLVTQQRSLDWTQPEVAKIFPLAQPMWHIMLKQ